MGGQTDEGTDQLIHQSIDNDMQLHEHEQTSETLHTVDWPLMTRAIAGRAAWPGPMTSAFFLASSRDTPDNSG